jgi:hypothetical protein
MRRMMLHMAAPVLLAAALFSPGSAFAGSSRIAPHSHMRQVPVTFRLVVPGSVASTMTFWVAYGPLAGHFGIIQLVPKGNNTYSTRVTLPAQGRTTFTYLAAFGRIKTRMGYVPRRGDVTIKTLGPTDPITASMHPVRWLPPLG